MDTHLMLNTLLDHYDHAHKLHPEEKSIDEWTDHIEARLGDVRLALEAIDREERQYVAGKRALQTAALALRMMEDLGLEIVGPGYAVGPLKHSKA